MKIKTLFGLLIGIIGLTIKSSYGIELTHVANYLNDYYLTDVAIGDFDGDGYEDLVVPSSDNDALILLKGQSDGTFINWKTIPVDNAAISVAVADFNGDSKLDIVAGGYTILILLNDGSGNFTESSVSTSRVYYNIIATDLDNDGDFDIVTANYGDKEFTVLKNNGGANFTVNTYTLNADEYPLFVVSGDFNNDNYSDILVGGDANGGSFVNVYLNDHSGNFALAGSLPIPGSPWGIDTGDFNNDGKLDFAVVNYNSDSFSVFLGNGDGTFAAPVKYDTDSGPTAIAAVDLDNDSKVDIVVANYDDSTIQVFTGNGDGTFTLTLTLPTSDYPWMVKSSDFNNDGLKDIVVSGDSGVDIYLNVQTNLTAYPTNYIILEDHQLTVEMRVDGASPHFLITTPPVHGTLSNFITNGNTLKATYTPAQDYYGSDQISFKATNIYTQSSIETVSITILPVNDAPSFDIATNKITVNEDSPMKTVLNFVSNISKGAENERSQPVYFVTINDNNSLFSIQPYLRLTGGLIFKPAPNAHGSAHVTAYLIDGGGTANGGQDTSQPKVFTIDIININDPPVIKPLDSAFLSRSITEDSSTVYHISVTDLETPANNLNLTVTSTNQNLVPNGNIQIVADGTNRTVTVTPLPNQYGTTLLTFMVSDGTNSATKTSLLRVLPVNDQPYFELLKDTVVCFAIAERFYDVIIDMNTISTGPANEKNQAYAFYVVSNTNPGLFSSLPVVTRNGEITFTPRKGASGTATIGIKMVDNGGTSYGGINSYGPVYLDIQILPH